MSDGFPRNIAIAGVYEHPSRFSPDKSEFQIMAECTRGALDDAGLTRDDIDGLFGASMSMGMMGIVDLAEYLDLKPDYIDGSNIGGSSFVSHVNHAAAAINDGLCETVLITHGESGRSNIVKTRPPVHPGSLNGQFEAPYGVAGPPTMFTLPVLRYCKEYGVPIEKIANVAAIQREWAGKNPRAMFQDPITVDDVMNARMIAWPFTLLMCCLVTDGGGALVLTSADRAKDFPTKPVYIRGTGESAETPLISQMEDFTSSRAFRVSGKQAFEEAGITHADVDHLMIYDAFAHLPIYGLEDLGFVKPGEAGAFIADGNTRPGGQLPLNTNGGGLSYMHSGMYGMYALQEGMRQMRGVSDAQVDGAEISVVHGVGSMFGAAGTIVLTNNPG